MVMSGFAPTKLFETPVDPDQIKERLAAMQAAAVIDPDSDTHAESFGIWEQLDPPGALAKRLEVVVEVAGQELGIDFAALIEEAPSEVEDALLDWWNNAQVTAKLPAAPDGVIDNMLDEVARTSAKRVDSQLGTDIDTLLDYPQFFLSWLGDVISKLVLQLTDNPEPHEVYIEVPNVDIPLTDDAYIAMIWGYDYGSNKRRPAVSVALPWFGRHVVKQDWRACMRFLALTLFRELPEKFDDEED